MNRNDNPNYTGALNTIGHALAEINSELKRIREFLEKSNDTSKKEK